MALLLFSGRDALAQRLTDNKGGAATRDINLALREDRFADVVEFTTLDLRGRPSPKLAAQLHCARGRGYLGLHRPELALAETDEAIRLDAKLVDAHELRAYLEENAAKWREAAADRSVALGEGSDKPAVYFLRGHDYEMSVQKALARRDYEKVAAAPAKDAPEYFRSARARAALGQDAQAALDYEAAKRMSGSAEILNGAAWFEATCPSAKVRDGPTAVRDATRACEHSHWKNPDIVDTLAAAWAETGDFARALSYEKQAIELEKVPSNRKVLEEHLSGFEKGRPAREDLRLK